MLSKPAPLFDPPSSLEKNPSAFTEVVVTAVSETARASVVPDSTLLNVFNVSTFAFIVLNMLYMMLLININEVYQSFLR